MGELQLYVTSQAMYTRSIRLRGQRARSKLPASGVVVLLKSMRLQGDLPPFLVIFLSKSDIAFSVAPELLSVLGDVSAGGLLRAHYLLKLVKRDNY